MKVYVLHWYDTEDGNYFVSVYSSNRLAYNAKRRLRRKKSVSWTLRYKEIEVDSNTEVKIPNSD